MNIFIILGMHRSGTSCLIGTLKECGVYLGPINIKGTGNPKGNQEIKAVWQLNDKLIQKHAGDWVNPQKVLSWDNENRKERDSLLNHFEGYKYWAIKDPRFLFTLDFWLEGMDQKPNILGTFRHPLAVADSLFNRNKIDRKKALQIWKEYNLRLLEILQEHMVWLVCFDDPAQEYLRHLNGLTKRFGLILPTQPHFFEDALRSSVITEEFPDKESEHIYNSLKQAYKQQILKSFL